MAAVLRSTSTIDHDRPMCYMCYAPYSDNEVEAYWVRPCQCKGGTSLVHQACLLRWIDQKQSGNLMKPVRCPQCNAEYTVVYPNRDPLMPLLIKFDSITHNLVPLGATLFACGTVYWALVTYGGITICLVMGQREGLELLESLDPVLAMFVLPVIPITMCACRFIPWDDWLLRFYRNHILARQFRPSRRTAGLSVQEGDYGGAGGIEDNAMVGQMAAADDSIEGGTMNTMRKLCGGMILPVVCHFVGRLFFSKIESRTQRTAMGGVAYILVKGIIKLYFKQGTWNRKIGRYVADYPTTDEPKPTNGDAAAVLTEDDL